MLTTDEKNILSDYKKAVRNYRRNFKVVDLDDSSGKKLNCLLVRLQDTLPELNFTIPPHRQSNFLVIYTTKGEGKITIGNIQVPVIPETLMVVPNLIIRSGKYSEDTEGYYLSFNLTFFLQQHFPAYNLQRMNLFHVDLMPYAHPNFKNRKSITAIFETILEERNHNRIDKNEMIAIKIIELLIICQRIFKQDEIQSKKLLPPLVVQYINLIHKHYKEKHSTSYYAEELHVHPNYLNTVCKRYLSQSAKATIDLKLLTEARYLLNQTTLTVKEIAYELGFKSTSHFFRFFKRHTSDSPLRYRQTI